MTTIIENGVSKNCDASVNVGGDQRRDQCLWYEYSFTTRNVKDMSEYKYRFQGTAILSLYNTCGKRAADNCGLIQNE